MVQQTSKPHVQQTPMANHIPNFYELLMTGTLKTGLTTGNLSEIVVHVV